MRLKDYFPEGAVKINESASDWQHAIDLSMATLLALGYIRDDYIKSIKEATLSNGPYYMLAPGIAMPHARPECGALKTGLSLTLLRQPVVFDENNDPVKILIGLAAFNSDSHINAIQALSELLCDESNIQKLLNAQSEKQIEDIISLV